MLLTESQTLTLQAAANRIVPADEYPSAWEAGAETYFARLLAREPRFLPVYQAGLRALDAAAGGSFALLGPDAQDTLLRRLEAEEVAFVRLLIAQTLESFYADPGNGGNKNAVAWDMIGHKITA